jgi:hypothetical protein
MTLRTLSRNYLGSAEAVEDLAQVQAKQSSLAIPESPSLPKTIANIEPTPPVRAEVVKRTALRG